MKKTALLVAALLMTSIGTFAQSDQTQDVKKAIREHYAAAKEYIEEVKQLEDMGDIYPVPQYLTATIQKNLPGTGYHQERVKMYYHHRETDDDVIYEPIYLNFATKTYNFAAREYYEEYLYDPQGRIEFIYSTTPDIDWSIEHEYEHEFRFYFNKGKLMEVLVKRRLLPDGTYETIYTGKSVPKEYREYFDGRYNMSESIMHIFDAINNGREL